MSQENKNFNLINETAESIRAELPSHPEKFQQQALYLLKILAAQPVTLTYKFEGAKNVNEFIDRYASLGDDEESILLRPLGPGIIDPEDVAIARLYPSAAARSLAIRTITTGDKNHVFFTPDLIFWLDPEDDHPVENLSEFTSKVYLFPIKLSSFGVNSDKDLQR